MGGVVNEMKPENRILELVSQKPMLMSKLQKESAFSTKGMIGIMAFLEKYKLVETRERDKHELMAKITPRGLQLLNLPGLPEDESSSNLLEVMERHWADEMEQELDREADLNLGQKTIRFDIRKIRKSDVIRTKRSIVKDNVLAKLVQAIKEKREFSEAIINLIKAREDKRQRVIAEGVQ